MEFHLFCVSSSMLNSFSITFLFPHPYAWAVNPYMCMGWKENNSIFTRKFTNWVRATETSEKKKLEFSMKMKKRKKKKKKIITQVLWIWTIKDRKLYIVQCWSIIECTLCSCANCTILCMYIECSCLVSRPKAFGWAAKFVFVWIRLNSPYLHAVSLINQLSSQWYPVLLHAALMAVQQPFLSSSRAINMFLLLPMRMISIKK